MIFVRGNNILFVGAILIVTIAVGAANGAGHFFTQKRLAETGQSYHPYSIIKDYDATNVIGPRIRDTLEGRVLVGEIDTFEYQDGPYFWPPITPSFYLPFAPFTDSAETAITVSDYLYSPIIFLLLLGLFFVITKRKWPSLFFAGLFSLYPFFSIHIPPPDLSYFESFFNSLFPFTGNPEAQLLARRESFIPALIPFLGTVILFAFTLTKERYRYFVGAGILYALNAYVYPFHFLYLSVALGIFGLIVVLQKDWQVVKKLFIALGAALIALIPFFINYLQLQAIPYFEELLSRHGREEARAFRFSSLPRYAWLLILSTWIYLMSHVYRIQKIGWLVIALLLAGIAVLNMQLLLGFSVQSDHWLNRDIVWAQNIAYFMLGVWILDVLKRKVISSHFVYPVVGSILLISIFSTVLTAQYIRAEREYETRTMPKYLEVSLSWLDEHTTEGDVVMTPSFVTNYFIPLHTHNLIFVPRALNTLASEKEILDRLFITYLTFGVSDVYLADIIGPDKYTKERKRRESYNDYEKAGVLYLFALQYAPTTLNTYTKNTERKFRLPKERYDDILGTFNAYSCVDCGGRLKTPYRVDYLYYGPQEKEIAVVDLNKKPYLKKVYDEHGVQIYKVNQ